MRREEPEVSAGPDDAAVDGPRVADSDQSILENEYLGDDMHQRSTPAPDQNVIDEVGRAYGVQEEDSGALRASSEILDRRDHHRSELIPPHKAEY